MLGSFVASVLVGVGVRVANIFGVIVKTGAKVPISVEVSITVGGFVSVGVIVISTSVGCGVGM